MNTSALKTFAPAVRLQLMEAVTRKLDFVLTGDTADLRAMSAQRESLRRESDRDRKGLVERVAYTWFNRLAALRFMDAHGWHPFGARVITAPSADETLPELLRVTRSGQLPTELAKHTDAARLNRLLDGALPSSNPQGEVYRHLFLAACRFYHALLPNLFEKLDDETELLLPDDLLTEHSVVHGFRTEISDEDCGDGQRANVEILGWLYQFYISDRKDQVMARKSAVPTEDIPAVTQLFTPHWIVRYLVENSLGRLWLLNRPQSRLRAQMPYYIEGEGETGFLKIGKPEEIKLIDPAAGSAHMLTYSFDLLYAIYEEEGYAPTEIPALILRHNLHGLEICPRAAQLAELALVFKAREKSRRFFQPEHLVRPRIIELRDVRFEENELRDYIRALGLGDLFNQPMLRLLHQFEEAKNFGSLIQPCLDERTIAFARHAIAAKDLGGQLFLRETHLKVLRVLEQAEALTQRYHVVVANPPYLGANQMNGEMKVFAKDCYPASKSDLFAMFIDRSFSLTFPSAYSGLVTMQSWMFLTSFESFRKKVISEKAILSMAHLGARAFDTIGGEVVQAVAFTAKNINAPHLRGTYLRLIDGRSEAEKSALFLTAIESRNSGRVFAASNSDFGKIPGCPLAYWATAGMLDAFKKHPALSEVGNTRLPMTTGDNGRFMRQWFEVGIDRIGFGCRSRKESAASGRRWFPCNKGGPFRRWYGNNSIVVDWENDGERILELNTRLYGSPSRNIRSMDVYFRESITWSSVSSSTFSVRHSPEGFLFATGGSCAFPESKDRDLVLGALLSKVSDHLLQFLSPTLNFEVGTVGILPLAKPTDKEMVSTVVSAATRIARADWDNFETSWDFRDQPLLRPGLKGATLEASWRNWEAQSTAAIRRMQELETENNRLFIAAYGLDGELKPEVPEAQITLARAEARRDMAAFLSYAVGCMMGRYGLDHPGLILANAGDSLREFLEKVGKPLAELTFTPDEDGIIPVLDGEWFKDDIVARTRDFLRATFGDATLNENIRFIEESLGKDLRKYFLTDFYKNHLQTYKKRPIYWLFRSPKGAFAALVYLHRMTRDTPNLVLNRYLRNYLIKLRARIEHLDHAHLVAASAKEKTAARKESDQLKKNLRECEEWERDVLLPLAQSRPALDLDDGVKVNYLKLGEALAPIAGLAAAEDE